MERIEKTDRPTQDKTMRAKFAHAASPSCAIHEPNFGYANSILEKWHKAGIHTMDAVAKADQVYQQQRTKNDRPQPSTASQFTNFRQRNNDYQDLQQQLLQKSMSSTANQSQS